MPDPRGRGIYPILPRNVLGPRCRERKMQWVSARRVDLLCLFAFGIASSVWCLTAATRLGATFDEPFYIKAGLATWRTGSNKPLMRSGVMTLPTDVQTLPIHVWDQFRELPFDPVEDLHSVLPLARGMNLLFWWLLLVYAMRLGRTFGGVWAGRLAVALVAVDPNLLGHATLATTDIASTACLLVLVYHFWHGLGKAWNRRLLVPGLCYGLAIQAKASGMIFGMEAMFVLGIWHLARTGKLVAPPGGGLRARLAHLWHAGYPLRKDLAWIAGIGFLCVFAYTGTDWKAEPGFVRWADGLPEGNLKSMMVPLSQNLTIFTNAGEGILFQIKHNIGGHGTFLLGEWYDRATWRYFPVALSMKVPLSVFGLLAAVVLIHPRHLLTPPAAVAVLLFLLSPTCRVQIGIRFMFPAIVLGYVALGAAVARGWASPGSRFVPSWYVATLLAVAATTSVWVWPHGMSYFNRAWGGPDACPELLHDSNCDWGQGLPELREWMLGKGESSVAVWYYGNDPVVNRDPFHRAYLSHLHHGGEPARIRWVCGGRKFVAVSVGCLHGHDDATAEHRAALAWVRTQSPVARTTYFAIYRVPEQ